MTSSLIRFLVHRNKNATPLSGDYTVILEDCPKKVTLKSALHFAVQKKNMAGFPMVSFPKVEIHSLKLTAITVRP